MFSVANDPKQFLVDLEQYLDQGSQANQQILSEIASWLKDLSPATASESDVKAVQLLGTAAGKQWDEQSMFQSIEYSIGVLTTSGVWQDLFREYDVLATVLNSLDPSSDSSALNNQYLRVIGNSIAYNGKLCWPTLDFV